MCSHKLYIPPLPRPALQLDWDPFPPCLPYLGLSSLERLSHTLGRVHIPPSAPKGGGKRKRRHLRLKAPSLPLKICSRFSPCSWQPLAPQKASSDPKSLQRRLAKGPDFSLSFLSSGLAIPVPNLSPSGLGPGASVAPLSQVGWGGGCGERSDICWVLTVRGLC